MNKVQPFQPKASFYMNDGVGRDTYISYNSGGMQPSYGLKLFGTQTFNSKICSVSPKIPTKTSYYFPNGSGRDYYILKTQGNGSGWEQPRYKRFQTQLRFYEPENRQLLNMASPKNIQYFENLKRKNQELLKRLVPLSNSQVQEVNKLGYEKPKKTPKYFYANQSKSEVFPEIKQQYYNL